jgi:ubiquinone/menaquinone biosynthesis C-methylase UbiE
MTDQRRCDYEGSRYRTEFWEDADRAYEDAADRLALAHLLPRHPQRLLEIGAGFGRLADLYGGATDVVLLDYASSMLQDARARLGDAPYTYVCADLYALPFGAQSIDTVVQVRVLHHVEDLTAAFLEVARVLRTGGSYVLEFANKRHAKAVVRYFAGEQPSDPFDPRPVEFAEMNWNFHPAHVEAALEAAGLTPRARRSASLFRAAAAKRRVSSDVLARGDQLLGGLLSRLAPGPSQYVRAARLVGPPDGPPAWRCPRCACEPLETSTEGVPCRRCGTLWPLRDGVYMFRADLVAPSGA